MGCILFLSYIILAVPYASLLAQVGGGTGCSLAILPKHVRQPWLLLSPDVLVSSEHQDGSYVMSKIRLNFVSDEEFPACLQACQNLVVHAAPEARALLELLTRCLGSAVSVS